ncbi:type II pantothenate kinase [Bacillus canaveralius]|uniref:Type II pantothenate kinase n=1 Tax=Bacillus canaveralius TaxID=1403243 RepID=A0A2N5GFM3_9BACI|nr:type II pantothenate kinase [Bacillus canaveralius]PLR79559.1 type II pantothenate kinase [Bacillus canaveralius]PLR88125.1 type II pantothenate kinase [Bacillus canaveralius]RSK45574.1 type II pantothenate kinase [Bacillus canaveralius]
MSVQKIGIDAGGSLIKIAYEQSGSFHYRKYPIADLDSALGWLKMLAPDAAVALTGGKSALLKEQYFQRGFIFPEFDAACTGAVYFLKDEQINLDEKFIIVNIGTGTSWFVVEGSNYSRILGSGIGGGTLMGLGALLTGETDYSRLIKLAETGEKGNVDMLVKDIYFPQEPPIDGNLTASNFAKGSINPDSSSEDRIASVINMIGETVILLSMQAAVANQATKIVYIGSTLAGNEPLKQCLASYKKMVGLEHIFLDHGEYCGAIGALMSL